MQVLSFFISLMIYQYIKKTLLCQSDNERLSRFLNELIKYEQVLKFSEKPLTLGECGY
jgi:hypothetical protein